MDVAWTLKKGMDLDIDYKKPESLAIATQATESCTIVVSHVFPVSCNKNQVTICDNFYMKIHPKNQPARTNLDPPCGSFVHCFLRLTFKPCLGWKHPNTLFPHIPFTPNTPSPFQGHPSSCSWTPFGEKFVVNTENSTMLADVKNVKT